MTGKEQTSMNKQQSPVAAIKQVLRSNKITFLCVVFTIAVFGSLIGLFENRFNPGALSFLGTDLYDILGRDAMEVLDTVSGAIFAFSMIGLIPQILTAMPPGCCAPVPMKAPPRVRKKSSSV